MANYYFKHDGGADSNAGTSPQTAWQTGVKLETEWAAGTFLPGDKIFIIGDWPYQALLDGSGSGSNGTISDKITFDWVDTQGHITGEIDASTLTWEDLGGGLYRTFVNGLNPGMVTKAGNIDYPAETDMLIIESITSAPNINDWQTQPTTLTSSSLSGKDYTGGWLRGRGNAWEAERRKILAHSGDTVTLNGKPVSLVSDSQAGNGFYVENLFEFITATGDWAYDENTGEFRIMATTSNPGTEFSMKLVSKEFGLIVKAAHVRTERLDFSHHGTDSIRIEDETFEAFDCHFTLSYNSGVWSEGSNDNLNFQQCSFRKISGVACFLDSGDNWVFHDNIVEDIAVERWGAHMGLPGNEGGTFNIHGYAVVSRTNSNNGSFMRNYGANFGAGFLRFDGFQHYIAQSYGTNAFIDTKDGGLEDGGMLYHYDAQQNDRSGEHIIEDMILIGSHGNKLGYKGGDDRIKPLTALIYCDFRSYGITIRRCTLDQAYSQGYNCIFTQRTNRNHTIEDNIIRCCGRTNGTAAGAWTFGLIMNNRVNKPYSQFGTYTSGGMTVRNNIFVCVQNSGTRYPIALINQVNLGPDWDPTSNNGDPTNFNTGEFNGNRFLNYRDEMFYRRENAKTPSSYTNTVAEMLAQFGWSNTQVLNPSPTFTDLDTARDTEMVLRARYDGYLTDLTLPAGSYNDILGNAVTSPVELENNEGGIYVLASLGTVGFSVDIASPANGYTQNSLAPIEFTAATNGGTGGVTGVDLDITGAEVASIVMTEDSPGVWKGTFTPTVLGSFTATVTATADDTSTTTDNISFTTQAAPAGAVEIHSETGSAVSSSFTHSIVVSYPDEAIKPDRGIIVGVAMRDNFKADGQGVDLDNFLVDFGGGDTFTPTIITKAQTVDTENYRLITAWAYVPEVEIPTGAGSATITVTFTGTAVPKSIFLKGYALNNIDQANPPTDVNGGAATNVDLVGPTETVTGSVTAVAGENTLFSIVAHHKPGFTFTPTSSQTIDSDGDDNTLGYLVQEKALTSAGGAESISGDFSVSSGALDYAISTIPVLAVNTGASPVVQINSPANLTEILAGGVVDLDITATDDVSVSTVEVFRDGVLLGPAVSEGSDKYSYQDTLPTTPIPASYLYEVKATDGSANITTASITINVPVVPPAVEIDRPEDGSQFVGLGNIPVSVAADDGSFPIATIVYHTVENSNEVIGQSSAGDTFEIIWNVLAAGTYNLYAEAFDTEGNSTTSPTVEVTITEPFALPVPDATSLNSEADTEISASVHYRKQTGGINFDIGITNNANLDTMDILARHSGNPTLDSIVAAVANDPGGNYAFTYDPELGPGGERTGIHIIVFRITDTDVPPGTNDNPVSVQIEELLVQITSPSDPHTLNLGDVVSLEFNISDSFATLTEVQLSSDLQGVIETWDIAGGDSLPTERDYTPLAQGAEVLTLQATNDLGIIRTATLNLTVDPPAVNQPPVVVINSPADQSQVTEGTNITFNATITDIDGTIASTEVLDGNTSLGAATNTGGDTYEFSTAALSVGFHTITIRATDDDTAVGSASIQVEILAAAPVLPDGEYKVEFAATDRFGKTEVTEQTVWLEGGTVYTIEPLLITGVEEDAPIVFDIPVPQEIQDRGYTPIFEIIQHPTNGTISSFDHINGMGTFTPGAGFTGTELLKFQIRERYQGQSVQISGPYLVVFQVTEKPA